MDFFTGDATGLAIPAHPDAMRTAGAAFLTEAFRRFGSLPSDNAVTRVVRADPCPGGSTGAKLFLTLAYARPEPDLPAELFVKFSRDFADKRRDWQRHEMAGEVRLAALSRRPGFPIEVPETLFGDYEAATGTGLLVTERIRFGEGGIEPHRGKCLDHLTLDDPLPHYRALVTALATLAGTHKAGRLGDIDAVFPFDPQTGSTDRIRHDEAALRQTLAGCADFARRCPQLMPAELCAPDFLAQVERDALRLHAHQEEVRRFLDSDPDLIALCHWNAHIDNAWFERGLAGDLRCGLIDWGRVGQLTFGAALWGCLSAAHHDIWDHHLDDLLALFADRYAAAGGPRIDPAALALHFKVHMATMGVSRVLDFPEVTLFRLPEAEHAEGPRDPMFLAVDPARNCLHIYTAMLKYWRAGDFGAALDAVLA